MAMEQIVRKSGKVSLLLPPTAHSQSHPLGTSRFGSLTINVAVEMGPTHEALKNMARAMRRSSCNPQDFSVPLELLVIEP